MWVGACVDVCVRAVRRRWPRGCSQRAAVGRGCVWLSLLAGADPVHCALPSPPPGRAAVDSLQGKRQRGACGWREQAFISCEVEFIIDSNLLWQSDCRWRARKKPKPAAKPRPPKVSNVRRPSGPTRRRLLENNELVLEVHFVCQFSSSTSTVSSSCSTPRNTMVMRASSLRTGWLAFTGGGGWSGLSRGDYFIYTLHSFMNGARGLETLPMQTASRREHRVGTVLATRCR